MAMIDKIRKRRELVIIVIGLGMLGFLIPYDAVLALFKQGANKPIGEVNGQSISIQRYDNFRTQRNDYFNYTTSQALEQEVWSLLIEEVLLGEEYDELGIAVTESEFDDITYGDNISQFSTSMFYQAIGGVTPENKENWRIQFEDWKERGAEAYAVYNKAISDRRARDKWLAMIRKGVYVNAVDAEYAYKLQEDKRTFDFVLKKYDEIPDSVVSFDDSDIQAYFRAHKNDPEYEQETGRDIEYIEFNVEPSEEDRQTLLDTLTSVRDRWLTTTLSDSLFTVLNAESGRYTETEYRDGDFDGPQNENFLFDSVGSYIGPYEHGNYYRVIKILDRGMLTDSAECRHILLNAKSEDEMLAAEARLDSMKKAIKAGAGFEDLVERFSDDPGKATNNGLYEWFGKRKMVPEFEKACFEGEIGDMPIVRTQYGVHLIEILGQKKSEVTTLASCSRAIRASEKTVRAGWNEASEFSINYSDQDSYRAAVDTSGFTKKEANDIRRENPNVGSLRNAYDLINWAYDAEVGEVSQPIQNNESWIVALLTAAREGGVPKLDDVREVMEEKVIEEKKAEMYIEIMGDETLTSPQAVADACESRVRKANAAGFGSLNIPGAGAGREPEVIGLAFGIPVGEMSVPIRGTLGIYVIAPTDEIVDAPEKDNYIEEFGTEMEKLQNRSVSITTTGFYGAIKESANIEDERYSN